MQPPMSATRPRGSFTDGDLPRHVTRLSGFMIMGFLAMTLAQFVEAVYLGILGTSAIAAVTFTFPVVMALSAASRGIGIGTSAVLARAVGGGESERAAVLASHGLFLDLIFNVVCAVLLLFFAEPLFHLLGARGEILDLVVAYVSIWALGFPLFGLAMVGSGLMRSIGDPAFPGYVMAVGSGVQVLIGPFLIFGWFGFPALGIEGAAWSFVLARSLSFLMTAYWFTLKRRMIRASFASFFASARTILHVGIPAMATNLIEPLSSAVITRLLASFGTAVVAGFGVAARIDAVVFMVVIGISSSTTPLVGQNWGARLYDRVDRALALCYRYCLLWGVIAATIMWVGGQLFVSLINDDPEVVATATTYLYILPITLGFAGMFNVANGAFQALSKPAPALILSLLRLFVFYVPLALVASQYFGYTGVFAVAALTNVVFGLWGREWNRRVIVRERERLSASAR